MKVAIIPLPPKFKGVTFWRIQQPYGYLRDVLGKDIFIYDPSVHDIARLKSEMMNADIIIYQSPNTEEVSSIVKRIIGLKTRRPKVVADYDDNLFNVSPWNAAYKDFGTKDFDVSYSEKELVKELMSVVKEELKSLIKINPDGSATITMWKDKTCGFYIEDNLKRIKALQSIIEDADLITVTTQELSNEIRNHGPQGKIAIFPNLIDIARFRPMKKKNDGKLRIVWHGSTSHYQDLRMVSLELTTFAINHPEVVYLIKGVKFPGFFNEIKDRVTWLPWDSDIDAYFLSLSELSADIAICPLVDNEFNHAKSPLKWEEMSAMKVPCVCSPPVYSNFVEHGKTGLLAGDGQWGACLEELLDPAKREQIGQNAFDEVKKRFSIEKAASFWKTLEDLVSD